MLSYVQQRFPFWNRTMGRDHFMWFTGVRALLNQPGFWMIRSGKQAVLYFWLLHWYVP